MPPPLSMATWTTRRENDVKRTLEKHGAWVSFIGATEFIDAFPPFTVSAADPSSDPSGWRHRGYVELQFKVTIPAIMDELGRVKSDHEVVVLYPRGMPIDPLKWGWFFNKEAPYHPNILSGRVVEGGLVVTPSGKPFQHRYGAICIGMAGDSTPLHQCFEMLKIMLAMEDPRMLVPLKDGGINDPWDPSVLETWQRKHGEFRSHLTQAAHLGTTEPAATKTGFKRRDAPPPKREGFKRRS